MVNNEENIGLDYLWIKFHSTVDSQKMQKISHLIKKISKLKYCKLENSRSRGKSATRLIWDSMREISLLAYLMSNEKYRRRCKNHPVSSGSTEGPENIGALFIREPNTSTNTSQLITQLLTVHRCM